MSAQPVSPSTGAPHFAFVPQAPILASPSLAVVPASQPCTHVHPTVTRTKESPTLYPPPEVELKTDQTRAKYHEEPIKYLAQNDHNSWLYSLRIEIPTHLFNPTLTSLIYVIKYGTTHDNGNSTVQADIVLTTNKFPVSGIIFKPTDLGIYEEGSAYSPRMVKKDAALRLSMVPAVKCNGGNSQWSHYIDHRHLIPNVRITKASYLYLIFHVAEYPTTQTSRSLAIEVSASWAEDLEARKAADAAKRAKANEEAISAAPLVADENVKHAIKNATQKLPQGDRCTGGFSWNKTKTGYECDTKHHSFTFKELGITT